MVEITASLIKNLREKTGAGMMDCKKALLATAGEFEEAIDWLRKKGLATASKKSDRITAEGLVAVASNENCATIIEVNSETDFVARNENFQTFVKNLAIIALNSNGTIENLKTLTYENNTTVEATLVNLISTIGENLTIRRLSKIDTKDSQVFTYIHNAVASGLGKIGVLVSLPKDAKAELGKQLAMHIAASKPKALDSASLSQALIEREKNVQREIAAQSGKPAEIIEKMLEGRIAKFYQEVCLLEQPFVLDPDKKVAKVLKEHNTKINTYEYFVLGEGIEKEEVDFAKEVEAAIK